MYYGITKRQHAYDIAEAVVSTLGGGENAQRLLLEVAQQETQMGEYRDRTAYAAGTGLCQFDEKPFYDIISRTRPRHIVAIKEAFGIDMATVQWRELEHSPLLSFIACRLFFKLIPDMIPGSIEGRANYWKKYYNTVAGKGTTEEYTHNAQQVGALTPLEALPDDTIIMARQPYEKRAEEMTAREGRELGVVHYSVKT